MRSKHSTLNGNPVAEFITAKDLQRKLGIGRENAYRLMNEEIGFVSFGRLKKIPVELYEKWIKDRETVPK